MLKMRSSIPFVSRFDRLSRESDRLLASVSSPHAFPDDERKPRCAASVTALDFGVRRRPCGSGAVDEIVEPVDGTLATVRHQLDLALVARLGPCRGGGGDVQVQSERCSAIEFQCGIDLEKMEM